MSINQSNYFVSGGCLMENENYLWHPAIWTSRTKFR